LKIKKKSPNFETEKKDLELKFENSNKKLQQVEENLKKVTEEN